jgi:hypothetical protein
MEAGDCNSVITVPSPIQEVLGIEEGDRKTSSTALKPTGQ